MRTILAAIALFGLGNSIAEAATVGFTVKNSTTAAAAPTYTNTCGTISPALQSVAAGATSGTYSVACGTSTAVVYDYTSGSKVCRFNLSSLYTPANPLTGASAYWTPSGTATSRGTTTATCKATLSAIGTNGNYTWATSLQ